MPRGLSIISASALAIAGAAALLAGPQAAHAQTPIAACDGGGPQITAAGPYVLTANLVSAAGDCLTIAAGVDNVDLDLAGFEISGPGDSIGITDGVTAHANIAVRNGAIITFDRAVNLGATTGAVVDGISATGNTPPAVSTPAISVGDGGTVRNSHIDGNSGLGIDTGVNALVAHNSLRDNTGVGMNVDADSRVFGNVVDGNGLTGISVNVNVIVSHNTVTNNGGAGIAADDNLQAENNVASDNGEAGITSTDAAIVKDNTTSGNGFDGIFIGADSTVTGNTAFANTRHGIQIVGGRGTVTGNTTNDNGNHGIRIRDGNGSTVGGNTSSNNGDHGIALLCPSNLFRNTMIGNAVGAILFEGGNPNDCLLVDNLPKK